MGSASSKASRAVARGAPTRKYPQRVPPNVPANDPSPARTTGSDANSKPLVSGTKDQAVTEDAADPDFARSLRSLSPVTPSPQFSNSSTFSQNDTVQAVDSQRIFPNPANNPALRVLDARARLSEQAEMEIASQGRQGAEGARQFLDTVLIKNILQMRDVRGLEAADIEQKLNLKPGVVARLGKKGVFAEPS